MQARLVVEGFGSIDSNSFVTIKLNSSHYEYYDKLQKGNVIKLNGTFSDIGEQAGYVKIRSSILNSDNTIDLTVRIFQEEIKTSWDNLDHMYVTGFPFFRYGDLKNGNAEMLRYNEAPFIFMIIPDALNITRNKDKFLYKDATFQFIIADRYDTKGISEYSSRTEMIERNVTDIMGQVALDFNDRVERNPLINKSNFNSNIIEQIPLGVTLRSNENGKSEKVFDGNYTGVILSVTTDIYKSYSCREVTLIPTLWDDTMIWDDTMVWNDYQNDSILPNGYNDGYLYFEN